jgi:hypothetical protein
MIEIRIKQNNQISISSLSILHRIINNNNTKKKNEMKLK